MSSLKYPKAMHPTIIKKLAAKEFNVSLTDLEGPSKSRDNILPRAIAMKIIRDETGISFARIGRTFGGRDHSTIINAVHRAKVFITHDIGLREKHKIITTRLYEITGGTAHV